jgi:hypothetical protein
MCSWIPIRIHNTGLEEILFNIVCATVCTAGEFLKTLEDPDLNVRRVALVAFNSAAHNKPSLIRVTFLHIKFSHNN